MYMRAEMRNTEYDTVVSSAEDSSSKASKDGDAPSASASKESASSSLSGSSGSAGPWHLCGLEDEAQALAGHMALVHAARCSCDVLRDACTHAS